MSRLTLRSPAKLNLFLKVLKKRPDGYHNIQTVFERIDLHDVIELASNRSGRITLSCGHPSLRKAKDNLATKAAVLLRERYRVQHGVDIRLTKNIPVAAGLGGGSGNAAAVLSGLNRLWGLGLSSKELADCGRALGSDVPFFLNDCSWARGEERGDRTRPVRIPLKLWHVLVVPCLKIYSREVFTRLNLQLTKTGDDVNILIRSLRYNNINKIHKLLYNELEESIFQTCPRLSKIKDRVQQLVERRVLFSGSGPSIFCIAQNEKEARSLVDKLQPFYRRVYAVRTF